MAQRMMVCLAIAALAGAVSCTDAPTATRSGVSLEVGEAGDSLQLTYICGNMFRVRNKAFTPVRVRWDIYGAVPVDTGSLRVRGRDVGAAWVDYYVTARTKGTMRLFVRGEVEETKANGNKVACAAPVDTTPLPAIRARTEFVLTPTVLNDSTTVSRTQIDVRFEIAATAQQKRGFQQAFSAQYLGSVARLHLFRIPDIGDNPDSLSALLGRMNAFAGVRSATFFQITGSSRIDNARFPDDANGYRRSDYINRNGRVWAQALRLPQAWGCETGGYNSLRPKLAVLEQNFAGDTLPDFSSNVVRIRIDAWKADTSAKGGKPSQIDRVQLQEHGAALTSVLTAQGMNGVGLAGVLWNSATTVFSMENTDRRRGAAAHQLWKYGKRLLLDQKPRVLSLSSDFNAGSGSEATLAAAAEYAFDTMQSLLDSVPDLLIVKAAGNDQLASGAYQNLPLVNRVALLTALLQLRDSTRYHDRILIVGATDRNTDRASFSNNFPEVEIYAPGADVPLLRPDGTVIRDSGTSFATPAVAGIAANS